jgi:hypothetical protein
LKLVEYIASSMMRSLTDEGILNKHHTCSASTEDLDKAIVDALKKLEGKQEGAP